MTLIAVASSKGSPGGTSLARLIAVTVAELSGRKYPGSCLVDLDPAGGDVAVRYGLDPAPGAATLALAGRHGLDPETMVMHSQRSSALPGVAVVTGVAGPAQCGVLEMLASQLADASLRAPWPVVVDVGRLPLPHTYGPLIADADLIVAVSRDDTAALVHMRSALAALGAGERTRVLVSTDSNPSQAELSRALCHPVALVLPRRLLHQGPAGSSMGDRRHRGARDLTPSRQRELARAINLLISPSLMTSSSDGVAEDAPVELAARILNQQAESSRTP